MRSVTPVTPLAIISVILTEKSEKWWIWAIIKYIYHSSPRTESLSGTKSNRFQKGYLFS